MDRAQLPQGCRATKRRQFTFSHSVLRSSWYSLNQPWKDERMLFTLEPPSSFELRTPGLGNQHPNHYDNLEEVC